MSNDRKINLSRKCEDCIYFKIHHIETKFTTSSWNTCDKGNKHLKVSYPARICTKYKEEWKDD